MEGLIIYSNNIANDKWLEYLIKLLSDSKFYIDADFENFVTDYLNNYEVVFLNED